MATLTAGSYLIPLPGVNEDHEADLRLEFSTHQFCNITVSSNEVARQFASWIREHRLIVLEEVFPKGGQRLPGHVPPSWKKRTGSWSTTVVLPDGCVTVSVCDMGVPGDPRLIINFIPNPNHVPSHGKPRTARKVQARVR